MTFSHLAFSGSGSLFFMFLLVFIDLREREPSIGCHTHWPGALSVHGTVLGQLSHTGQGRAWQSWSSKFGRLTNLAGGLSSICLLLGPGDRLGR